MVFHALLQTEICADQRLYCYLELHDFNSVCIFYVLLSCIIKLVSLYSVFLIF